MANLAQLKERVAQLANKGGSKGGNKPNLRWTPTDEHDIRVIPYGVNPLNDSILEMHFHYTLGETRSMLCPESTDLTIDEKTYKSAPGHTYEKKCIVNEYCSDLWSKFEGGKPGGALKSKEQKDADFSVWKKIKPQTRFAALVVERGKESDGAKWWCFSQKQLEQIIKLCDSGPMKKMCGISKDQEAGYAVLVDQDNAFDLHVSVRKAKNEDGKGNATDYSENVLSISADEPTSLGRSKKETQTIMASVKPFTDAYPLKTSEEVAKVLEAFMKSEFTPESKKQSDLSSDGIQKYGTNSTEDVATVGDRLANEAIEDLMNA